MWQAEASGPQEPRQGRDRGTGTGRREAGGKGRDTAQKTRQYNTVQSTRKTRSAIADFTRSVCCLPNICFLLLSGWLVILIVVIVLVVAMSSTSFMRAPKLLCHLTLTVSHEHTATP